MQVITLKVADNGVIKEITDDNINAGGESYESVRLYEFSGSVSKIKFIHDLCVDIGLDFGNSRQKKQMQLIEQWGEHYSPDKKEIESKITELQNQITNLSKIK